MGMSESRPQKRKIEFIESYWTGGEFGSDYQWDDNHGELIRCKDCKFYESLGEYCQYDGTVMPNRWHPYGIACKPDWFCADGKRKEGR